VVQRRHQNVIVTPPSTAEFQAPIPRAKNPDSNQKQEGGVRLVIDRQGQV